MKEHFAALAAFIPALEAGTFDSGKWAGGETVAENTMTMPWFDHGKDMSAFLDACYPLMLKGFAWPEWIHTADADRVQSDFSVATEEEIRKVITAMIRQERFVEGLLASACQNGTFLAIARRAAVLAS
jgi:hypothetical protein